MSKNPDYEAPEATPTSLPKVPIAAVGETINILGTEIPIGGHEGVRIQPKLTRVGIEIEGKIVRLEGEPFSKEDGDALMKELLLWLHSKGYAFGGTHNYGTHQLP